MYKQRSVTKRPLISVSLSHQHARILHHVCWCSHAGATSWPARPTRG